MRHALRGAALPVVSYLGPAAAALLTGSVVVETIFGLPGVGRYFVEGALNRDYTLVMGTVVLVAVFVLALQPPGRRALRAASTRACAMSEAGTVAAAIGELVARPLALGRRARPLLRQPRRRGEHGRARR